MSDPSPARSSASPARFIPVIILVAGLALFFVLGLDEYLGFEALRQHRAWLVAQVEAYGVLAGLVFMLVYAVVIALSIPGGAALTLAAGFLFGTAWGAAWVVVGATLGAVCVFLAARTAFADMLRARAGPGLRRMEAGFKENALSYLLVLRLIPLFPFWLVNIVPAFLGVPLRTYAIATVIGIIPGAFVFASVGAGLGSIFDTTDAFDPAAALTPQVVTALVGLAVLSLLPVAYKKIKARRTSPVASD